MNTRPQVPSVRKAPWLILALLWTLAWLAYQGWLLYQDVVSPLFPVLQRQRWWQQEGDLDLIARPLLVFLVPALGLYFIFAWMNCSAFYRLLLPKFKQQRERVIVFLGQLLLVTMAASLLGAWLYPTSVMGNALGLMLIPRSGQYLALGLGVVVLAYFLLWVWAELARGPRFATWSAALLLVIPMALAFSTAPPKPRSSTTAPDIILIGVDSLRPDHLSSFGAPFNAFPNIETFVRDGVLFKDTLTTQAHTFPATASILTGLYPTNSGARGNLFPPSQVRAAHSIAWRFQAGGWRTLFATDETRFSNIDEIYGFEQIVGPGMGVPDYLMSFVSDTVLVNLAANTTLGRWLFPHLYGNRAVAHAYRPESFSRRLEAVIDDKDPRPLFLYAHFCSGHWPYEPERLYRKDGFDRLPAGQLEDTSVGYLRALASADRQVGNLLQKLKQQGRLDNSIVVLFSDHGEDFGMQKDDIRDDAGASLKSGLRGHGTSAAREPQVRVLLAWQRHGRTGLDARVSSFPASVVDIAPTLAELAALPQDQSIRYDGVSLGPPLGGEMPSTEEFRIRYVESSKIFNALGNAKIDVGEVVAEAGSDFGLRPDGRLEVRPEFIAPQITMRERAAWSDRFIALLPSDPDVEPLLLDRQHRHWESAETRRQQAAPLMAGLCDHWRADAITRDRCEKWQSAPTAAPPFAALRSTASQDVTQSVTY